MTDQTMSHSIDEPSHRRHPLSAQRRARLAKLSRLILQGFGSNAELADELGVSVATDGRNRRPTTPNATDGMPRRTRRERAACVGDHRLLAIVLTGLDAERKLRGLTDAPPTLLANNSVRIDVWRLSPEEIGLLCRVFDRFDGDAPHPLGPISEDELQPLDDGRSESERGGGH